MNPISSQSHQSFIGSRNLLDFSRWILLDFRLQGGYGQIGAGVIQLNALQYRRMDFEEFYAAALSVHQLEALDRWEQHARCAYELFEKDGNRAIVIEELASEKVKYNDIATEKQAEFESAMADYIKRQESGEVQQIEDDSDSEFDEYA